MLDSEGVMAMSQMRELTVGECLELLRSRSVGRIGMRTEAGLRILPVSYVLDGDDRIVFRTLPYGVIAGSAQGAEAAFEVDQLDEDGQVGWSVLAVGTCRRIEDPDEVQALRAQRNPEPWADGQRNLYFKVDWSDLTGRRVGPGP
jgi:uncharacterized protein